MRIEGGESTDENETESGKKEEIPEPKKGLNPPEPEKKLGPDEQEEPGDSAARAAELQERLLRLQAEFENYKKRAEREREAHKESSSAGVILRILPVLDEFEIALSHMDKAQAKEFRHGIELIYSKLRDTLKKEGVEEMKALGESFDPYRHDALRQGDGEEGKIVEVIVKGYTFKGKVLRHAKVVVGKGKEAGHGTERDRSGKEGGA